MRATEGSKEVTSRSFPFTRLISIGALFAAGVMVSGCVGGTTYGTGTSQEVQTIKDLTNILSLKKKRNTIDYDSRPDLVVPDQKQLVTPQTEVAAAEDPNWPVTPERRIAEIREEADAANDGSLLDQIRYANQDKDFQSLPKPGKWALTAAPVGQGVPNVSCDPDGKVMRKCTAKEISQAVRTQRKADNSGSTSDGPRRYLTDPPNEYRTPAETAETGDLGYTEEELAEIREAERKKRIELQNSRY